MKTYVEIIDVKICLQYNCISRLCQSDSDNVFSFRKEIHPFSHAENVLLCCYLNRELLHVF